MSDPRPYFASKASALKHLKARYHQVSSPIAFSGVTKLYHFYRGLLSREDLEQFLSTSYTYTTKREFHKPFQKNPIFSYLPRQLVELGQLFVYISIVYA